MRELMQQQEAAVTRLLELLQGEQQLIIERDSDALQQIVTEKNTVIAQIQENDLLLERQAKDTPEVFTHHDTMDQVQCIQRLLSECKKASEVNRLAVEQTQLKITQLRNLLAESRAKETMTYDKLGRKTSSVTNHSTKA